MKRNEQKLKPGSVACWFCLRGPPAWRFQRHRESAFTCHCVLIRCIQTSGPRPPPAQQLWPAVRALSYLSKAREIIGHCIIELMKTGTVAILPARSSQSRTTVANQTKACGKPEAPNQWMPVFLDSFPRTLHTQKNLEPSLSEMCPCPGHGAALPNLVSA